MIYDSLLDVPLDEPGDDGDDRLVPGVEGVSHEPDPGPRFLLSLVGEPDLVVPFRGPLQIRSRGPAVKAMKRALSRAGYVKWHRFDGVFYKGTREALMEFQRDAPGVSVDGVYGPLTHRKLARFYDAYAIEYLLGETVSPEQKKRNAFLAQLMYVYNRRWQVAYSQTRPFDLRRPPSALDCSASGEWAAKWAGIPSPSGYSGYGYGNTDTQIARLRSLGRERDSIRDAEIGDPKFYGRGGDPSHVAYYIGHKEGVARVWSFGSYPAKILDASYRHDSIGVYALLA
ncbi:MAG: peptidoglycan-binding protein [Actinobacteria bacterium]|nr:peptidoglycan-binding protein [Actinomycetota bacterium]